MSQYLWTKKHGDNYRKTYANLTFQQIQDLTDSVQTHNYQVSQYPFFLLSCLEQIKNKTLNVAELGGYDGYQALTVMETLQKQFTWTNYDISKNVDKITQPELVNHNYKIVTLTKPFFETYVPTFDVFYSSKTLEHVCLKEVLAILTHMKTCKHQIHIIDWFKNDDMHIIEDGSHNIIVEHLKSLNYKITSEINHPVSSLIFAEHKQ